MLNHYTDRLLLALVLLAPARLAIRPLGLLGTPATDGGRGRYISVRVSSGLPVRGLPSACAGHREVLPHFYRVKNSLDQVSSIFSGYYLIQMNAIDAMRLYFQSLANLGGWHSTAELLPLNQAFTAKNASSPPENLILNPPCAGLAILHGLHKGRLCLPSRHWPARYLTERL